MAVTSLPPPPAPTPQPPGPPATCHWSPKTAGHSPGSSLKKFRSTNYEACQRACCDALPACEAIIFNTVTCYLADRKVTGSALPAGLAKNMGRPLVVLFVFTKTPILFVVLF